MTAQDTASYGRLTFNQDHFMAGFGCLEGCRYTGNSRSYN
jgi:hypothetical protein